MVHPTCRLCEGETLPVFSKQQLGRYQVQYFRCCSCHSLQTQKPVWLNDVRQSCLPLKEIGLVKRTLFNARLTLALAIKQKFERDDEVIDFGGGTGLFTRLIRDFGLNGFWSDKFAENLFAIGFEKDVTAVRNPKMITAFEVFQHLVYPVEEIKVLVRHHPDYLLFSTRLYDGEGKDWWYLKEDGQQVQFYSHQALANLAKQYNYYFSTDGKSYHLFSSKKINPKLMTELCKSATSPSIECEGKWPSRTETDTALFQNRA